MGTAHTPDAGLSLAEWKKQPFTRRDPALSVGSHRNVGIWGRGRRKDRCPRFLVLPSKDSWLFALPRLGSDKNNITASKQEGHSHQRPLVWLFYLNYNTEYCRNNWHSTAKEKDIGPPVKLGPPALSRSIHPSSVPSCTQPAISQKAVKRFPALNILNISPALVSATSPPDPASYYFTRGQS